MLDKLDFLDIIVRYPCSCTSMGQSPEGGAEMAKVSGKYETVFIVNPTIGDEAIASVVEKFKSLIEANGTIETVDDWGKRRLAYEINDLREGHYTLIQFESAPSFPAELDRVFKITDGIMRSIIVSRD